MNLTSDHPFWLTKNGLQNVFPPIETDIRSDVVVVGAGITGAMLAQRLAADGLQVIVVDRRDVCTGSTSASTALLQYEIDITLVEMSEIIGRENAEAAYKISHKSIDDLQELVQRIKADCGFERRKSIYLATDRKAAKLLAEEARARDSIGLDVNYHDQRAVADQFGLDGVAAISTDQAACCDPYRLAHALLANAADNGAKIFDRSEVTDFDCQENGVRLTTNRGAAISAKWAVIATGYESQNMLKEKIVNLDNTYAVISQPLETLEPWNANWMLWEAKNPYLYLRITADNRLLVGGEDDAFHSPKRRDASIDSKSKTIETKVHELIPGLDWEIEFAWAGTFGKTHDGLAYIGPTSEYPSCLFALGFGGNGITFSSIATNQISEHIAGRKNEAEHLFRFGR